MKSPKPKKTTNLPKLQGNDYVGLQKYSDFLRQGASAAKVIPSLNALSDIRENMRMQAKLPNWHVKRWARVIADHKSRGKGHFPSFDAFVDLVCSEAEIACNPCVYTNFARKNENPRKVVNQRNVKCLLLQRLQIIQQKQK